MRMTTTTYKADYKKAEMKALKLLEMNNASSLPIKVKSLAEPFSNLRIKTYSWFSKKYNVTFEEIVETFQSDEGCCWYDSYSNKYLILYNEKVENKKRIRWTLAHELGHFMLKHNELSKRSIIARSSLSDNEYDAFESEANVFARSLLAHPAIICQFKSANPHFISDLFHISYEAACNVYMYIQKGYEFGFNYSSNHPFIKFFSNTIQFIKNNWYCMECDYSFAKKTAHFCPICGNKNIVKQFFSGDGDMKYQSYETDEINRLKKCIICSNEEIVGDYCQICGTYLVNKCTGFSPEHIDETYSGKWHDHFTESCGTLLDANARFCHNCGSTSLFYKAKTLKSWLGELTETDELPF